MSDRGTTERMMAERVMAERMMAERRLGFHYEFFELPTCGPCISSWGTSKFFSVVEEGDAAATGAMLEGNISLLRATMGGGRNAWHIASGQGHLDVLKVMVHAIKSSPGAATQLNSLVRRALSIPLDSRALIRANLRLPLRGGATPLMVAARHGHAEVLSYLLTLDKGGQWMVDHTGKTAVHHAVRMGQAAATLELLRDPPEPPPHNVFVAFRPDTRYVDVPDFFGWTPLHYAVYHGHVPTVTALLSHGANLILRTLSASYRGAEMPSGMTALHLAAHNGSLPLVKLLLRAYFESNADLLPSVTAMMDTEERAGRRRLNPDPRLIVTRTCRLAYHIAHRLSHTTLLEWLDPSIPLIFLFAGSGQDVPPGADGGSTYISAVPRLTLIAAAALHDALVKQLEVADAEVAALNAERLARKLSRAERRMEGEVQRSRAAAREARHTARRMRRVRAEPPDPLETGDMASRSNSTRPTQTHHRGGNSSQSRVRSRAQLNTTPTGAEGPVALLKRIMRVDRQLSYSQTEELSRMGVVLPEDPTQNGGAAVLADRLALAGRAPQDEREQDPGRASEEGPGAAPPAKGGASGGKEVSAELEPSGGSAAPVDSQQSQMRQLAAAHATETVKSVSPGQSGDHPAPLSPMAAGTDVTPSCGVDNLKADVNPSCSGVSPEAVVNPSCSVVPPEVDVNPSCIVVGPKAAVSPSCSSVGTEADVNPSCRVVSPEADVKPNCSVFGPETDVDPSCSVYGPEAEKAGSKGGPCPNGDTQATALLPGEVESGLDASPTYLAIMLEADTDPHSKMLEPAGLPVKNGLKASAPSASFSHMQQQPPTPIPDHDPTDAGSEATVASTISSAIPGAGSEAISGNASYDSGLNSGLSQSMRRQHGDARLSKATTVAALPEDALHHGYLDSSLLRSVRSKRSGTEKLPPLLHLLRSNSHRLSIDNSSSNCNSNCNASMAPPAASGVGTTTTAVAGREEECATVTGAGVERAALHQHGCSHDGECFHPIQEESTQGRGGDQGRQGVHSEPGADCAATSLPEAATSLSGADCAATSLAGADCAATSLPEAARPSAAPAAGAEQAPATPSLMASIRSKLKMISNKVVPQVSPPYRVTGKHADSDTDSDASDSLAISPVKHGAAADLLKSDSEEEIDGGDDDNCCPVCLDEPPNLSIAPCHHQLCMGCAKDLCKRHVLTPVLCPYCRTVIGGFKAAGRSKQRV